MLPCYVMVDLETTGGNAVHDRITEIAAVRMEGGVETARWSTLVNPETPIPPFIQALTGISDSMVASAPTFAAVAAPLLQILEGAVFVAHNVRFDHSFVLHALARIGIALKVKTLCTVRLSRKLYPQHKGHGLDALVARHGLHTQARHRAMGDVDMVLQWLAVATAELGVDTLRRAAQELLQGSGSIPPQLETPLGDIPDSPGVYSFYGDGDIPLYIGKSVTMRSRVLAHFQAASRVPREMRILNEIRRVEWQETAGELGALLLEARLVKALQPLHNRQLRRERALCAWQLHADCQANPLVKLVQLDAMEPSQWSQLYGSYRSRRQAMDALRQLAENHALCPQRLGLESGKGPCFACQTGRCRGLCAGREPALQHHARLQMALAQHRLQAWPYAGPVGIREYRAASDRTDIHVFDHWCHIATVQDRSELEDALQQGRPLAFDLHTYRLLQKHLGPLARKHAGVFPLVASPSAISL